MNIKKLKIYAVIVTLLWLFLSINGLAQVRGKLRGMVVDSQDNPLEKATITIVSTRLATQRYETKSGKDGKFAQVGIYPGYYQVTIKKEGYLPRTFEVHVEIDGDTNMETIKLETADERAAQSLSVADRAFMKANEYFNKQDYEKAVAGYQEAIGLSPNSWAYHFNLGLAYKKLNKLCEAREAFNRAVQLNPNSFSANKELGELLAREEQYEAAAEYYRKAVELSPNDPDAHYNLGACLVNLGQGEEALGHFQKAVEIKPDYAEAHFQLGSIYISQNKKAEAIASLEKFIELSPQHEKASLARQLLEYLKK